MDLIEIEKKIDWQFKNQELLRLAFIHRSYWNENQTTVPGHNERLEFLGDSVLSLIVAEYLFLNLQTTPEGVLSDLRSRIVESFSCYTFLQKLSVSDHLQLGRGEKINTGKGRETILADLFEALIGAIYLDSGYEGAREFFLLHFKGEVDHIIQNPARNWKADLQDYTQKLYQQAPVYEVLEESGPAHQRFFRVSVSIFDKLLGEGVGGSKKEAQASAAKAALEQLTENP